VPLPPLPEQRRIADILGKADALRAKRRAALAQLDSLTQSIFLDMFGDPATNQKGWPTTTLGDVLIAIRNGANAEQREEPGGWPITRIETISDGTINPERVRWIEPDESLLENFQLEPGDILFSHINSVEHIGKTALYAGTPTPLIHGINLLRLRPRAESVDPVWLLHLLKNDFVRTHFRTRCKKAVNQASLNQPDIKSVQTFLPPLSLQHAFARRVAASQSLECVHRASLSAQDSLFASLQHRAFRGEL
jgi:type I restriction enzyme S subunit